MFKLFHPSPFGVWNFCNRPSLRVWNFLSPFFGASKLFWPHTNFPNLAATNPLSDCPGQLKILSGNQKFKVLCPNGQLKSRSRKLSVNWNFVIIFDILTDICVWHFILKQVEGDSLNLICRQLHCMSLRDGVIRFFKQFRQHQIWCSKVRHHWAIDLQCHLTPWGYMYLLRKICRGLFPTPHQGISPGGTDLERRYGDVRPWSPPFLHLSCSSQGSHFKQKCQFTILRKFGNFSFYSLHFCPNLSSQAPKFGNFQLTSHIYGLVCQKSTPNSQGRNPSQLDFGLSRSEFGLLVDTLKINSFVVAASCSRFYIS